MSTSVRLRAKAEKTLKNVTDIASLKASETRLLEQAGYCLIELIVEPNEVENETIEQDFDVSDGYN